MNKKIVMMGLLFLGNLASASFNSASDGLVCVEEQGFNISFACSQAGNPDYCEVTGKESVFCAVKCVAILADLCLQRGLNLEGNYCWECVQWGLGSSNSSW